MPGFRIRLQDLPEQPRERRISVHWFFLPVGLGWLVGGALGVRDWLQNTRPLSMYWGLPCALLGVLVLVTFVMCQMQIRRGKPPKDLFTVRARQLVLFGGVAASMALCFVFVQLLPGMAWAWPLVWLFGVALIWGGIVRYFRKHPPKG
jgi:hypothetical protein